MNVSVLIITHDQIGAALVNTVRDMLGISPIPVEIVSVLSTHDPDELIKQAEHIIKQHEYTLVLTDMYGSTPSNIACHLHAKKNVRIVSGINLPMLVRVLNYPRLSLDELQDKAISGGHDGVLSCKREHD